MLDIGAEKVKTHKIYVINLRGRIDAVTSRDFETFYEDILRAGHRYFIFEASRLEFISSAGLSVLVKFARRLESLEGMAVFLDLNKEILLTFSFFGLDQKLPAFNHLEDAREFINDTIRRRTPELIIESGESLPAYGSQYHSGQPQHQRTFMTDHSQPVGTSPASPVPEVEPPPIPPVSMQMGSTPPPVPRSVPSQNISIGVARKPADASVMETKHSVPPLPVKEPVPVPDEKAEAVPEISEPLPDEEDLPSEKDIVEEKSTVTQTAYRLIRCEQCGATLRVYHTGRHMCPECGISMLVKSDGSVSYYEKL